MAIKLLLGGSPCTSWSIAQSKNRETTAEGVGWELFKNYLIVKEKFKPDFFLYENNKSAAQAIKDQIAKELGVETDPMARITYINSTLVSAQNRQRFYVTNFGDIAQPKDRGILLKDVLERGEGFGETKGKSYALCATYYKGQLPEKILKFHERSHVAEPVCTTKPHRVGALNAKAGQADRIYSTEGKSVCLIGNGGGGAITGLYAIAVKFDGDVPITAISNADGKEYPVYKVTNGQITIKDKQHTIKLADGYYIIRKLTVKECCRLQTMPDDYCRAVSASQGYKGLGNGWTAEVIIHLLNHALRNVPRDEKITALSLYDGIGTGRYCLDKMGFTNAKYHAYEIDKYAMQIAMSNYPDIKQYGDAFAVRGNSWKMP